MVGICLFYYFKKQTFIDKNKQKQTYSDIFRQHQTTSDNIRHIQTYSDIFILKTNMSEIV